METLFDSVKYFLIGVVLGSLTIGAVAGVIWIFTDWSFQSQ